MKKLLFFSCFVFLLGIAKAQTKHCDSTAPYFPNLFFGNITNNQSATSLLDQLIAFTGCSVDSLVTKTDSSLFYFKGTTTSFSPFSIKNYKVEYKIEEVSKKSHTGATIISSPTPLSLKVTLLGDDSKECFKKMKKEFLALRKLFAPCLHEPPAIGSLPKNVSRTAFFIAMGFDPPKTGNSIFRTPIDYAYNYRTVRVNIEKPNKETKTRALSVWFLTNLFVTPNQSEKTN